ncbi:Hypothetical predicted protein [Paramuricea clavata]|uniref:Uncharacterized protein n=1 Tax=Paramuricea clavata TaxID=317549 RepID=A0A6S7GUN1_PARCT|nr:Hypothetical predicted protein [Paramuricea clavata]
MVTTQLKFKLDTGSSVCVLSDLVPWLEGITLEKPQQKVQAQSYGNFHGYHEIPSE